MDYPNRINVGEDCEAIKYCSVFHKSGHWEVTISTDFNEVFNIWHVLCSPFILWKNLLGPCIAKMNN